MILILLSLTYLHSIVADCIGDIYRDFGYGENRPHNARNVWPMRAFLKLDIRDMRTEDGKGYFAHLHTNIMIKGNMLLPNQFCEVHAKGENGITICSNALAEKFLISDELRTNYLISDIQLHILKDTFWRYKETDFILLNPDGSMKYLDESHLVKMNKEGEAKFSPLMFNNYDGSFNYLYMYFHHLSEHFQYSQIERKLPYTPKDYCQIEKRSKRIKLLQESEEGSTSDGNLLDDIEN